jgi:DNA-directed RNA polymerase specialized sigma24 family protein
LSESEEEVGVESGCQSDQSAFPAVYDRLRLLGRAAGLPEQNVEDLVQDVLLWTLRTKGVAGLGEIGCLTTMARFFVLRQFRTRTRVRTREPLRLDQVPPRLLPQAAPDADRNLVLNELEDKLPPIESSLLRFIRSGITFAEASRRLGIPPGSQAFHRRRLVEHARAMVLPARAAGPDLVAPVEGAVRRARVV